MEIEVVSWWYILFTVALLYYNIKIVILKVEIHDLKSIMKENQKLTSKHIWDKYKYKNLFKRWLALLKKK